MGVLRLMGCEMAEAIILARNVERSISSLGLPQIKTPKPISFNRGGLICTPSSVSKANET